MISLLSGLAALTFLSQNISDAPIQLPAPRRIEHPVFEQIPTPNDVVESYPDSAQRAGRSGSAWIECDVTPSGKLENCQVSNMIPIGEGFEAAAIYLSKKFRLKPIDKDGVATAGRPYRVHLTWRVQ